MENQTEFDLNHAIQTWREHLSQSPSYRAENLEELESHLRDSVATLAGGGLSEEEAFLIATRRVGASRALEPEFAKVNGREVWLGRLLWMLVGVQAWWLISSVAGTLSRIGGQFLMMNLPASGRELGAVGKSWYGVSVPAIPTALFVSTNVASLVVLLAIVAGCGWLIQRNRGSTALFRSGVRAALAASALCLAILLGGVINLLSSQLMVRSFGPQAFGEIALSMNLASAVLFVLQTITVAILTVLLARGRFRLVSA